MGNPEYGGLYVATALLLFFIAYILFAAHQYGGLYVATALLLFLIAYILFAAHLAGLV